MFERANLHKERLETSEWSTLAFGSELFIVARRFPMALCESLGGTPVQVWMPTQGLDHSARLKSLFVQVRSLKTSFFSA